MVHNPSVGHKVNVPKTDTVCHAARSPIFKYTPMKLFVLVKFYLAQWLGSFLNSTLSVCLYPESIIQRVCHPSGILTVAGQISLPPVFSCDAPISTWKGQDQGQSLALCLWNGLHTFHPWTDFDSRSCLSQHLSNFLVQVNHLGMFLKSRFWSNEFGVSAFGVSEILHLQQAPCCCRS